MYTEGSFSTEAFREGWQSDLAFRLVVGGKYFTLNFGRIRMDLS